MFKNKNDSLRLYYQYALATAFVLAFFTNFDVYLNYAIGTPHPKILIIVFGVTSIPLFLSFSTRINYVSKYLFFWICGYLFISLTSFLLYANYQPIASYEELRTRLLSAFFMLLSVLIFSCPRVQLWVRYEILVITFMNVITNIYSLFFPDTFVTIVDDQSVLETSRATGFYVDANRATSVLILGIVLSINILPLKYRFPFILIIFMGAFVTFSRSGIISFLVVISILIVSRQILIYHQQILSWVLPLIIIYGIVVNLIGLNWLNMADLQETVFENKNLDRITQIQLTTDKRELDDLSSSRLPILEETWHKFLESPIWGQGIGYGLFLESNMGKRSHNMYLYFMLEHGFLGVLVFPLLVFCSIYNYSGKNKVISFAFSALILIWGLFSHNMLEHREFLISFSLMSTINMTDRIEQKYQMRSSKIVI